MLYILAFDHRSSFLKLIGAKTPPTKNDLEKARAYKKIIYQAFLNSISKISKKEAAILVDEWLGKEILKDAQKRKIIITNTFEKSGQEEFEFERKDWKKQLEKIKPDYVKVLIRYDAKKKEINKRQAKKLAVLNNYLKNKNSKFLLEVVTSDQNHKTIVQAVKELQNKGVHPKVWKLEGMDKVKEMENISKQVRSKIVILGRGGNKKEVEQWLKVAAKFDKVIGFAIGRTIFQKPLNNYNKHKISRQVAINKISQNYLYFVRKFEGYKNGN